MKLFEFMQRTTRHNGGSTRRGYPLPELLAGLRYRLAGKVEAASVAVTKISEDSRTVEPGALFVAVTGHDHDGHGFLSQALDNGAVAVVVEDGAMDETALAGIGAAVVVVADSRTLLGELAARFYGEPADGLTMIGITGTNGKTTVSYLLDQALSGAGRQVGVIGTVEYRWRAADGSLVTRPAPFTTPDPLTLHATLRDMAAAGVTHVVMEVSSHALEQRRLGPIACDLAVFTNFSQDHLDFHHTMANYFEAKCRLFRNHMDPDGTVVVMMDDDPDPQADAAAARVVALCDSLGLDTVTCGTSPAADFRVEDYSSSIAGISCRCIDTASAGSTIESELIGSFNIGNLLAAFAALVSLGMEGREAAARLSRATGAPGRMERVGLAPGQSERPTVIVDYAHTPDALEKALLALKELEHHTLFCVVGCGGNRDRSKRAVMGQIAATVADVVIVTDDNPRDEDPAEIRASIRAGIGRTGLAERPAAWLTDREGFGFVEIGDRGSAIEAAVAAAGGGDIVLIAGKGHERYQLVGDERRFFDDVLAARAASLAWTVADVETATGGTVAGITGAERLAAVSTDSRAVAAGDIFVALVGDRFDGHDFVGQAIDNGARCLIVSDAQRGAVDRAPAVLVGDTLHALGDLAAYRRSQVRALQNPIVVGLTGSCGKTTVKDMTAAIFSARWPDRADRPAGRVLKTGGNFNNLVGLPLSLLPVSAHQRALVLEMGMNAPGEIARLTEIAAPDIACITNVQPAHLQGLGTIDGVAAAKGELFAGSRGAVHVVNCDDDRVVGLSERYSNKTIGFAVTERGRARNPEVWAENIAIGDGGDLTFLLHVNHHRGPVSVTAAGLHNVANACAAAAIAMAAGIEFTWIATGLAAFRSAAHRMERRATPGGLAILDDSYNANPASMRAALETLTALEAPRRLAVLGDMLELGTAGPDLHREIGAAAAAAGLSYLGAVGAFADEIAAGAVAAGMAPERVRRFADKGEVAGWVAELSRAGGLGPGDWILIKASRGLALDTVVEHLMREC